jgi:uncharacterized protein (DUF697 family)
VATEKSTWLYDGCLDFGLGIDSGVAPQSLPRNQCAFAVNTTFRGDFPTDRPPYRKVNLDPNLNTLIQEAFGTGLFQGAINFKSDYASESIVFSIAGHLFDVIPSADSTLTSTGAEVSIPGDLNPATATQAWLWQAERWLINDDGLSIPIFYDGVSSRRSETTAAVVGTTAAPFAVPPIGGVVTTTLTANYTGLLNSVLNLDEVDANGNVRKTTNYLVTKVGGNVNQYQLVLENLTAIAGTTYSNGNDLTIIPSNLGTIVTTQSAPGNNRLKISLTLPVPSYVSGGMGLWIETTSWAVVSITADRSHLTIQRVGGGNWANVGDSVTLKNFTGSNLVIGTLSSSFTAPAIGSDVTTFLTAEFLGPVGQVVIIGTDQFQVVSSAVNGPAPSTTIQIQNLNDNADLDPTTLLPLPVLAASLFYNLPELPPARMGTYGLGRVWQSGIDGVSFMAGDIVGGSSGSPAFNNRDAVLKVTENSYLVGGGAFRVPGAGQIITAMIFSAILDVSLGQGPLQVFTNKNIFSCNTPVDRTTWQSVTNPIVTQALIGSGATSQTSVVGVNADAFFRSPNGQIRSEVLARLDFNRWGSTPVGFEVSRVLEGENLNLMNYCSAIQFDNRLLMTSSPIQGKSGVYWQGLVVMNFDPLSTLEQKSTPAYDGLWTGLNILQLIAFANTPRAFALCENPTTNMFEIYELLATGTDHFDNGTVPIVWAIESPMLFHNLKGKTVFDLLKLEDGEIYVNDVIGQVFFKIEYRPDFDTCWYPWHSWYACAGVGTDTTVTNPQYRKRMGFGQPSFDPATCNVNTDQPPMYGTMFQLRITVQGHCVINGFKLAASIQPQSKCAEPICNNE